MPRKSIKKLYTLNISTRTYMKNFFPTLRLSAMSTRS